MAVNARLFGLTAPDTAHCRVLEIACGEGGNLLPLAVYQPGGEYVGVDLAATAIEQARTDARQLRLGNIAFHHLDLCDLDSSYGEFDYIIAHGIYSWVPPHVRKRLLQVCAERLRRGGVAYISYMAYPGAHVFQMAREIARMHTNGCSGESAKVSQTRALLSAMADGLCTTNGMRAVVREQIERLQECEDGDLYHDLLEENNEAFYFCQFAGECAQNGLQYVAEANLGESRTVLLQPRVAETLRSVCGDNLVLLEQYADFFRMRRFRASLLAHADATVSVDPIPGPLDGLFAGGNYTERESAAGTEFASAEGSIATRDPLVIAAFRWMNREWPRLVRVNELAAAAGARSEEESRLWKPLLDGFAARVLELRTHPLGCAETLTPKPTVNALVRMQANRADFITNAQHMFVRMPDQATRTLLQLADGTRTHGQLREALIERLPELGGKIGAEQVTALLNDFLRKAVLA